MTTSATAKAATGGKLLQVPIKDISPSPFQTRTFAKKPTADDLELAASIESNGILQHPLIRKASKGVKTKYELIFGERRLRMAKHVGLKSIMAELVEMDDKEASQAIFIENAQRANIHALDEALAYQHLIDSEKPPMELREAGRRVGKDEKTIARRLSLLSLIEPARDDFRAGLIEIGHALEISRLAPEVQQAALDACYPGKWNAKHMVYEPDRDKPAKTVADLIKWISTNLVLDLNRAPWALDDATLVPAQGPCTTCPYNTAANTMLFADAAEGSLCTNAEGYRRKMTAHIERLVKEVTERDGRAPALLTEIHAIDTNDRKRYQLSASALSRSDYQLVGEKDACDSMTTGVFVHGAKQGTEQKVCLDKKCRTHAGRQNASSSSSSAYSRPKVPAAERHKRKQELFDIKIADVTRERVFAAALPTFKNLKALDRTWLNRIAAEFFVRIPYDDARVIMKLIGQDLPTRMDEGLLKMVSKFPEATFAQFLALCSFGHYGANHGGHHAEDQDAVKALAKERGIDYRLLDAEVRADTSPRKYKKAHDEYLEAVQRKQTAAVPKVYDTGEADTAAKSGKAAQKPTKRKAVAKKGKNKKKPAKKR